MSRSGYTDDCDDEWAMIRWRGAVKSAIRGKRGQAFLREMIAALDAMPEKRLVRDSLVCENGVCAMGAVALARGLDAASIDPEYPEQVADFMGIATTMAQEIAFENDDDFGYRYQEESPEQRWTRMRTWAESKLAASKESQP